MTKEALIPPSPSDEYYAVDADQGDVFTDDDPFVLFGAWLSLAREKEVNDPNAMSLATVDAAGAPDVRIVLLKDVDARGLTFFTNTESAKGRQLAITPKAALCFHWKTIRRQVRFRGVVTPVADAEADAYFATRARGARMGARASAQSRPMKDRATLEVELAAEDERHPGDDIPRPEYWSGYRVEPLEIEFWVNRPFRLHDRLLFARRSLAAPWTTQRLYP